MKLGRDENREEAGRRRGVMQLHPPSPLIDAHQYVPPIIHHILPANLYTFPDFLDIPLSLPLCLFLFFDFSGRAKEEKPKKDFSFS